jgi:hypothetical protein
MARGSMIHKKAFDYVTGVVKKLPSELDTFVDEFKDLRKNTGDNELKMAMTSAWNPIGFDDWVGAWVRVVVDHCHSSRDSKQGVVIDYKTGKTKLQNYDEQLELYAVTMFRHYPKLMEVKAELWYLDLGELNSFTYKRKDTPELEAAWQARVKPMLTDTRFTPKPNDSCRWCPHSKTKGGPCQY